MEGGEPEDLWDPLPEELASGPELPLDSWEQPEPASEHAVGDDEMAVEEGDAAAAAAAAPSTTTPAGSEPSVAPATSATGSGAGTGAAAASQWPHTRLREQLVEDPGRRTSPFWLLARFGPFLVTLVGGGCRRARVPAWAGSEGMHPSAGM